jgi:hypothetical protein
VGWLFGQVWALCAVSFLVGALVTWAVFARPQRRRGGHSGEVWQAPPEWASRPPVRQRPELPRRAPQPQRLGAPVDPALARLDTGDGERGRPSGPGVAATGALDMLGVTRPSPAPGSPPRQRDGGD